MRAVFIFKSTWPSICKRCICSSAYVTVSIPFGYLRQPITSEPPCQKTSQRRGSMCREGGEKEINTMLTHLADTTSKNGSTKKEIKDELAHSLWHISELWLLYNFPEFLVDLGSGLSGWLLSSQCLWFIIYSLSWCFEQLLPSFHH